MESAMQSRSTFFIAGSSQLTLDNRDLSNSPVAELRLDEASFRPEFRADRRYGGLDSHREVKTGT